MGAVRVRWSTLARRLGAGALALAALQALPSLLRPPEPPPPPADVGLAHIAAPRVERPPPATRAAPVGLSGARPLASRPKGRPAGRPEAAKAGSAPTPDRPPEPAPAAIPEPPPAPGPSPPPAPAPEAAPPDDGSVEFMPH